MLWLPTAVRDDHGRRLAWTQRNDPKGCLHTTETSGWPSYREWSIPPHATILPRPGKGIVIRQHIPFSHAAFALRNLPGGVQTNTDYVFQFELIGTSARGGPGVFWPEADDVVLAALWYQVIAPLSDAFHIPLTARPFKPYPESYGSDNGVRLAGSTFDHYSGWLGHQHVPENVHGDPGAFPWARMIATAKPAAAPRPLPSLIGGIQPMPILANSKNSKRWFLVAENRSFYIPTPAQLDELKHRGLPAVTYETETELLTDYPAAGAAVTD